MLIFDSHLDLAWNAVEWKRDLEAEVGEIRKSEQGMRGAGRGRNTVSFPELRSAGVGISIATILTRQLVDQTPPFIPYATPEESFQAAWKQVEYYDSMCQQGVLRAIRTAIELVNHKHEWHESPLKAPLGFILSMEGADSILGPDHLEKWYFHGLRIIGPAHYGQNRYTHGTGTEGGLKPDGFELLREMERLGFILDITHLTDEAIDQAFEFFGGPILASHHNCRQLVGGQRQLSDEHIHRLIEKEAVIGIAFDAWMLKPGWIRGSSQPTDVFIEAAADHIDHICQLAGNTNHIGIGSDLDGGFGTEQTPADLQTIQDLQKLPVILDRRGYSGPDIERILYGNWISFFQRAWAHRQG
ncbi:MAG: membrane dipeptidase [Acidobacteriota bacterium]|nr:MAG: membrane dipeptidase [Acidobacteriota bacterium]